MKRKPRQQSLPRYTSKLKDSMVLCTSSSLISVITKSKFLAWIESTLPGHEFDIRDFESRAYLVPDCDTQRGCEEWLIENSQQIFEEELREYDPAGKHWPPVRDRDNIWDYFMFIYCSRVVHLRRNNSLN